ncbi:glycylpeptide N-tetradecanoyltransferase [Friedmanniomyces endolithicus]|uniref:Glycylpeptide N-tetradecanoyltransferase n=1 Tax=Friedmanniomyces endolithicus TaxID=329885 RepID=A0AAN6HA35_9PEZI|nr:glycylpeptide N-tetradecanoyltransferase [Friedmanniomyces endolithicus]KAK0806692.1 glycylpeptide N-tetradecanoyltransferase [Friedmanniomyces endolithicus]KAK0814268.1 glycylpeptide N-tetradecanoyltransferase [Friedmanniomyces endolithicus]KAK0818668.1 glycylpeptide N-tetradecanoyltransferase [Friedmanniomyces endolithicus]KAK0894280.1 glycylpeptide N-tetradecanoyltransferase [Friedmanniomyces endolithicus]
METETDPYRLGNGGYRTDRGHAAASKQVLLPSIVPPSHREKTDIDDHRHKRVRLHDNNQQPQRQPPLAPPDEHSDCFIVGERRVERADGIASNATAPTPDTQLERSSSTKAHKPRLPTTLLSDLFPSFITVPQSPQHAPSCSDHHSDLTNMPPPQHSSGAWPQTKSLAQDLDVSDEADQVRAFVEQLGGLQCVTSDLHDVLPRQFRALFATPQRDPTSTSGTKKKIRRYFDISPGPVELLLLCPKCQDSSTCAGCGESVKKSRHALHGKEFITSWHCDRERLTLIWFILCGYDDYIKHNKPFQSVPKEKKDNATHGSRRLGRVHKGGVPSGVGYGGNHGGELSDGFHSDEDTVGMPGMGEMSLPSLFSKKNPTLANPTFHLLGKSQHPSTFSGLEDSFDAHDAQQLLDPLAAMLNPPWTGMSSPGHWGAPYSPVPPKKIKKQPKKKIAGNPGALPLYQQSFGGYANDFDPPAYTLNGQPKPEPPVNPLMAFDEPPAPPKTIKTQPKKKIAGDPGALPFYQQSFGGYANYFGAPAYTLSGQTNPEPPVNPLMRSDEPLAPHSSQPKSKPPINPLMRFDEPLAPHNSQPKPTPPVNPLMRFDEPLAPHSSQPKPKAPVNPLISFDEPLAPHSSQPILRNWKCGLDFSGTEMIRKAPPLPAFREILQLAEYPDHGIFEDFDDPLDDFDVTYNHHVGRKRAASPIREDPNDLLTSQVISALSLLLPDPDARRATAYDLEPPTVLASMLLRSSLVDRVAELLHSGSVQDATRRDQLYMSLLDFATTLFNSPTMRNTVVCAKRCVNRAGHDLLRVSMGLSTRMKGEEQQTAQPIAACLDGLRIQSEMIIKQSPGDSTEMFTAEWDRTLLISRSVCELAARIDETKRTTSRINDTPTLLTVDTKAWEKDLAMLEIDDNTILSSHAFGDEARKFADPPAGRMRELIKEITCLKTSLPPGIFVRYGESRMDVMKILIVGPQGTPYENGLWEFDLLCGIGYPNEPPKMFFRTTGGGQARVNPNLYACGKVCLSLLGTWHGEPWRPGKSTILQVLVSIQAMIFCDEPHCNEPHLESDHGSEASRAYNRNVYAMTVQHAMLEWLGVQTARRSRRERAVVVPSSGGVWSDVVARHFRDRSNDIVRTVGRWVADKPPPRTSRRLRGFEGYGSMSQYYGAAMLSSGVAEMKTGDVEGEEGEELVEVLGRALRELEENWRMG